MNVLDLFNTPYERALNEGAVDDLEARYIHGLNTKMLDLMARAKNADPEHKAALKQAYEKIKSERDSFYKIREAKQGQDVVDRSAKMKALQPAKPGMAGAVKDVAQGLKNFLQGKPETGPTYEAQKKNLNLSKGVIPTEPLPEHGGGIGPSQRWQDLMPEGWSDQPGQETKFQIEINGRPFGQPLEHTQAQQAKQTIIRRARERGQKEPVVTLNPIMDEGIKKSAAATALAACIAAGGTLSGCATNPSVGGTIGTVRDVGTATKTAGSMTRAGVQDELSQELRNFIRAQGGDPGSQNLSLLYKLQKRLQGKQDQQPKPINEIKDTEAVEQAILKRIMVAHRDMLVKYGPEKIMTAASDVAYNVGDIGEIGSSDISGWVKQVEQILGPVNETKTRLDPKCWPGKKIGTPKTKMKGGVRVNNCVPAESVEEDLRDPEDNPCWKGYKPVGTKQKGGRTVPNCVPNAKK